MSKLPQSGALQKRTSLGGLQSTARPPPGSGPTTGTGTPLQKKTPSSRLSISSISSRASLGGVGGTAARGTGTTTTPAKRTAGTGTPQPTRWHVGEPVLVEALNVSGTLRFLGTTQFKSGIWAGVELDPEFKGKGKNDGSVAGVHYFDCEPANGIFVLVTKLSRPAGSDPPPPTTSSPSKRTSTSKSLSTTRSTTGLRRPSSASSVGSVESDRYAPSAAERTAIATGRITAGSRASRYVGVTANQLRKGPLKPPPGAPAPIPRSTSPSKQSTLTSRPRQSLGPRPSVGRLSMGGSSLPAPSGTNRRSSVSSQSGAVTPTSPSKARAASAQKTSRPSSAASEQEQADTQQLQLGKMSNKALSSKISNILSRSGDDTHSEPLLSMFDQQSARIDQLTTKIDVLEENNARLAKEKKEADHALQKLKNVQSAVAPSEDVDTLKQSHATELAALREELTKAKEQAPSTDEATLNEEIFNLKEQLTAKESQSQIPTDDATLKEEIANLKEQLTAAPSAELIEKLKSSHQEQLEQVRSELSEIRQAAISQAASSKDELATLHQTHKQELEALHEQLAKAAQAPADDAASHEEALAALKSTHQKELVALRAELTQPPIDTSAHEKEISTLKESHEAELESLRSELAQSKEVDSSVPDFEQERQQHATERGQLLEQHSKFETELTQLRQLVDQHKTENEHLKSQIADYGAREEEIPPADNSEDLEKLQNELSDKTADLESVRSTLDRIQGEHDKEVGKMNETIKELRTAGAEAIEAYESKIADLESIVDQLKIAGQESIELLQESEHRKSGAIEVHAQIMKRNASLEGELDQLQQELSKAQRHIEEAQANGQADSDGLDQLHDELERAIDMEVRLREEIEDLTEKLDQSLESELQSKQQIVLLTDELNEARKRITRLERDRPLMGDNKAIADASLVRENRELQLEMSQRLNEMEEMKRVMEEINSKNERLKAERRKERESWSTENETLKTQLDHLRRFSAPVSPGESTTSTLGGNLSNEQRSSLPASARRESFNSTMSTRKEESQQILGLKHIIQELTKENLEVTQQNKLLIEETEELRKAQTALEVNVERLMADLEGLNGLGGEYDDGDNLYTGQVDEIRTVDEGDTPVLTQSASVEELRHEVRRLQREVTEKQALMDRLSAKHSQEIGGLRDKMTDIERKAAREVNALNKEVAELETLVESKIFKEDELEMKIIELKKDLRNAREGIPGGFAANHSRMNGTSSVRHSDQYSNGSNTPTADDALSRHIPDDIHERNEADEAHNDENLYCELCDEHGHDVLGCTKTWNNGASLTDKPVRGADERPYCENCEEDGLHWTEDCPNQDETF